MARASMAEVAEFLGTGAVDYDLLRIDGVPAALGGYYRDGYRTWVFLDVRPPAGVPTRSIVRGLRQGLEARGGTIHCICDDEKFPNAPRLLALLGFRPTCEMRGHMRIWEWQS